MLKRFILQSVFLTKFAIFLQYRLYVMNCLIGEIGYMGGAAED